MLGAFPSAVHSQTGRTHCYSKPRVVSARAPSHPAEAHQAEALDQDSADRTLKSSSSASENLRAASRMAKLATTKSRRPTKLSMQARESQARGQVRVGSKEHHQIDSVCHRLFWHAKENRRRRPPWIVSERILQINNGAKIS